MRKIRNKIGDWFKNVSIKRKIMYIYLCIGTVPMLLLGLFVYRQERATLIEREEKTIADALLQGVEQLNSQVLVYDNLSDYIAFNQPISEVLCGSFANNYEMYEQYTSTVDPVLNSLKFFNPNINQLTIYLDRDIVAHDTEVAPLSAIRDQKWYLDNREKLTQKVTWLVDAENRNVFSLRTMPMMEQNGYLGVMYLNVNYNNLFCGFDEITQDDYGLYIINESDEVLYQKEHFRKKHEEGKLSLNQLLKEKEKTEKGKNSDYMIVSSNTDIDGWQVVLYRPEGMVLEEMNILVLLVIGILAICILTSAVASVAFSKFVVRDITRLRDNMREVENGNMELTVASDSQDEVGGLIRGFGSMLAEINRLIHEVYESKLTQRKSEMTALQAQINPHFLYNSLSLINWKALEAGQQDISKITLALSSFYRTSLNRGKNVLTIDKELENMRSYLEIQSCMHDNDFDVLMDIDDEILGYQTLNLLLQPLVENAIDHGIDLKEDGKGYIKIIGRKDEKCIYLTVEDNGVGIEPELLDSILEFKTKGYGVRNVNQRIKLYYGEEYALQITSEVGKGTKCTIVIPKVTGG